MTRSSTVNGLRSDHSIRQNVAVHVIEAGPHQAARAIEHAEPAARRQEAEDH